MTGEMKEEQTFGAGDEILVEGMHELKDMPKMERYVSRCLEIAKSNPKVKDVEAFVVYNEVHRAAVHYSSALPSQITEPIEDEGLSLHLRVLVEDKEGRVRVGDVGTRSVFTKRAVEGVIELACEKAVYDPDFVSLPVPPAGEKVERKVGYDEKILRMGGSDVADLAFRLADGALKVYEDALEKGEVELFEDNYIPLTNLTVDGDVRLVKETWAYANTNGVNVSDTGTKVQASVTCGKEDASPEREWGLEEESKACSQGASTDLEHFHPENVGATAARRALKLSSKNSDAEGDVYDVLFESDSKLREKESKRLESGKYTMIFAPQIIEEMMQYTHPFDIMMTLEYKNSMFSPDMVGKQVMSPKISISDDPHVPNSVSSMNATHEGFPTKKTMLVDKGVFRGYVTNDYLSKKYRNVLDAAGIDRRPSNGFSYDEGYSSGGSCHPKLTNLDISSSGTTPFREMISNIKVGERVVFVTKYWYTYPTNKGHEDESKAFSENSYGPLTSSCPTTSYLIEKKEDNSLEITPLKPNAYRFFANVRDVFSNPRQISSEREVVNGWATSNTVIAPYMMIDDVYIEEIAEYIDRKA